jgi:hypothetical protein
MDQLNQPRWNGVYFNSNPIVFTPNHINVYMGNLFTTRNETRIFKWNNENVAHNIGRQYGLSGFNEMVPKSPTSALILLKYEL